MAEPAPVNPLDFGRPPRPCCPVHGVEMRTNGTRPVKRYWQCPVPGCTQTASETARVPMRRPRRIG